MSNPIPIEAAEWQLSGGKLNSGSTWMLVLSRKSVRLISAWWDSDELVAEAQQDKALEEESKEKREARERERRFNDSQYREGDDYYGSSS
jgi:hypothetical protein